MSTAAERAKTVAGAQGRFVRGAGRAALLSIPVMPAVVYGFYVLIDVGAAQMGFDTAPPLVRGALVVTAALQGVAGVVLMGMSAMIARQARANVEEADAGNSSVRASELALASMALSAAVAEAPLLAVGPTFALVALARFARPVLPPRPPRRWPWHTMIALVALAAPGFTRLVVEWHAPDVVAAAQPSPAVPLSTETVVAWLASVLVGFVQQLAAGVAVVSAARVLQVGRLVGFRLAALRTWALPASLVAALTALLLGARSGPVLVELAAALVAGGLLAATVPATRYTLRITDLVRMIPGVLAGGAAAFCALLLLPHILGDTPLGERFAWGAGGGAMVGLLLATSTFFVAISSAERVIDSGARTLRWTSPWEPVDALAREVRARMPAPWPSTWRTAERIAALALRQRLRRPFDRTTGQLRVDPKRLAELAGHPLSALAFAWPGLLGDDPGHPRLAARLTDGLPQLRRLTWLLDDRVFQANLDADPDATLAAIDDLIRDEQTGPWRLRWHWLRLGALGRLGRVGAFVRDADALVDQVCGPEFEALLEVGSFTDVLRGARRPGNRTDPDDGRTLISSRIRAELLSRIDDELHVVDELARAGGDPTVQELLDRSLRRLDRRRRDFALDADAEFTAREDARRRYRELGRRAGGLSPTTSRADAWALARDAILQLSRRNYAPILAGMPGTASRLTEVLAMLWTPETGGLDSATVAELWRVSLRAAGDDAMRLDEARRAAAAMVTEDLWPAPALVAVREPLWMPEISGAARAFLKRTAQEQGSWRAFTHATVAAHWRTRPEEPLTLLDAAARGAWRAGARNEAIRIAREARRFADKYGTDDHQARAELLAADIEGRAPVTAAGSGLWARLVRARAHERALAACGTAEALLAATGGTGAGDGVLLVQAMAGDEVLTVVWDDGPPVLHRRRVDRAGIDAALQELRTALEAGQPEFAWSPAAATLADMLLADLPPGSSPVRYLGLGALGRLPLSVLPVAGGRLGLVRPWTRVVTGRPPLAKTPGPGRSVALWTDGGDVALPAARRECEDLPGFSVMRAERGTLREIVAGAAVLHIAAHGLADRVDPDQCTLELADGPLTAAEIRALPVRPGALVFLSACESAVGSLLPEEHQGGLAGAFLAAGAGVVVATQWMVPDTAARRIAVTFHTARASGLPLATALWRARVACGGEAWEWGGVEVTETA